MRLLTTVMNRVLSAILQVDKTQKPPHRAALDNPEISGYTEHRKGAAGKTVGPLEVL